MASNSATNPVNKPGLSAKSFKLTPINHRKRTTPGGQGNAPPNKTSRATADRPPKQGQQPSPNDTTSKRSAVEWAKAAHGETPVVAASTAPIALNVITQDHVPAKSSLELRVFGLPNHSVHSAKDHMMEVLNDINTRNGRTYSITDEDGFIDVTSLSVGLGDPSASFINQSSCVVRLAPKAWYYEGVDLIALLDRTRIALIEKGTETFWSCAQKNDRRTSAIFSFRPDNANVDPINSGRAKALVTDLCENKGHPVSTAFATDFSEARQNGRQAQVFVKFIHVASVKEMALRLEARDLHFNGYSISYSPYQNVIFPQSPCTIVAPNVPAVPEHVLLEELARWIAKFNAANHTEEGLACESYMHLGRHFVVTPSSFPLTDFILKQETKHGYPYELAYDLNDRSLTPLKVYEERTNDDRQRSSHAQSSALARIERRLESSDRLFDKLLQRIDNSDRRTDQIIIDMRQNFQAAAERQNRVLDYMRQDSRLTRQATSIDARIMSAEAAVRDWTKTAVLSSTDDDSPQIRAQKAAIQEQLRNARAELDDARATRKLIDDQLAEIDQATKDLGFLDVVDNTMAIHPTGSKTTQLAPPQTWDTANADPSRFIEVNDDDVNMDRHVRATSLTHQLTTLGGLGHHTTERVVFCITAMTLLSCRKCPTFVVMLVMLMCLPTATAMPRANPLKLMTINVTGFQHINHTRASVCHFLELLRPHVLILTETRQQPNMPTYLPIDYTRRFSAQGHYESIVEPALPEPLTGVTILVHRSIPIARRVDTGHLQHARGRIAAVDIYAPDINGRQRTVRIIGVYAPTKPDRRHRANGLHPFWSDVNSLVIDTPTWIVGGDVNASLHRWEATSTAEHHQPYVNRQLYREFLVATMGKDAWEDSPQVRVDRDWTCANYADLQNRRILDRFITSFNLNCVDVITHHTDPILAQQYAHLGGTPPNAPLFPVTHSNHRPVTASVLLGVDLPSTWSYGLNRTIPRLRKPKHDQAPDRYRSMNDYITDQLQHNPPPTVNPASHAEYDQLLLWCHDTFTTACNRAYDRPSKPALMNPFHDMRASAESRDLGLRAKRIGRLVRAIKEDRLLDCLTSHRPLRMLCNDIAPDHAHDDPARTLALLKTEWRSTGTALRRSIAYSSSATAWDMHLRSRQQAIKGGRIKPLFEQITITNPPYLQTDEAGTLACKPDDKLSVWTEHFRTILTRPDPQHVPKPWLTSTAAHAMQERTAGEHAFTWPQLMSTEDVLARLRTGSPRPSPGPNSWEKWALAQCTLPFLQLIAALCNYSLTNNYFPPALKTNYIAPLYKKGDTTNPSNYRGVVLANCLYQLISGWFSSRLQDYVWQKALLSPTQIATQKGVQPADLIAFLDQLHKTASVQGTTIYAIKRDHTKGFDFLHSSAFFDSLRFFGLPDTVAEFERARTTQCSLRVKSQDGIAASDIITTGQTKQGGPESSLKYTLTMSMFTHYLAALPDVQNDIPSIKSVNGNRDNPHVSDENDTVKVGMVEATDDSLIFATSWDGLERILHHAEQFQEAYGIQTAWDSPEKTVVFTLGAPPPHQPASVRFHLGGLNVEVPFTDKPRFLRTALHDQNDMLHAITSIIQSFPIMTDKWYPIPLLRRAVTSLLMPRIRGRLSMQPLKPQQALSVDKMISDKIMGALGMVNTKSDILFQPISRLGFGFPSVADINAELAISSLTRSLNHHLTPLRVMARITLANLQCQANDCVPPFDDPRIDLTTPRPPTSHVKLLKVAPTTWAVAKTSMISARLRLVSTDNSKLHRAKVPHILSMASVIGPNNPSTRLLTLARQPPHAHTPYDVWADAVKDGVMQGRRCGPDALHIARNLSITDLVSHDRLSTLTRMMRRRRYEDKVHLAFARGHPPTNLHTWATDGSHMPNAIGSPAAAAVVGQENAMLRFNHMQVADSTQAEWLAMTAALIRIHRKRPRQEQTVLSDHLSTVYRMQRRLDTTTAPPPYDPHAGSRSTTLLDLAAAGCRHRNIPLRVQHVKAHTEAEDELSLLNAEADRDAKTATFSADATIMPPMTALMPDYTLWNRRLGFVGDSWKTLVQKETSEDRFRKMPIHLYVKLRDDRLDTGKPPIPSRIYTSSPTVVTARTQLLTRTGQYPTLDRDHRINPTTTPTPTCDLCRHPVQNVEHIFRNCPHFNEQRASRLDDNVKRFSNRYENGNDLAPHYRAYLIDTLARYDFWLGHTPLAPPPLSPEHTRDAHMFVITLTAGIATIHLKNRETRKKATSLTITETEEVE